MRQLLYFPVLILIWLWQKVISVFIWLLQKPLASLLRKKLKNAGISIFEKKRGDRGDAGEKAGFDVEAKRPWDITVNNTAFYSRICNDHSLGLGEAYVDGLWDCDRLDEFSAIICRSDLPGLLQKVFWVRWIQYLKFEFFNLQTARRAFQVGKAHYDLGNDLYTAMLDKNMNYTCGYWKNAKDLDQAQLDKMELIAQKLKLKPGMRVLDIGCGWGNLCRYLAEKYEVSVVGATVSVEQAKLAQERCAGLPVEIRVQDYRDLDEQFDRVTSVGMFEHVGKRNYREFYNVVNRCLKDDGLFLLHTIGLDDPNIFAAEPWLCTYIFPNGRLPYHTEMPKYLDGLFTIEDWHNFGFDYGKTLMAWHQNFEKGWPKIQHMYKDPQRFYRMWSYYLLNAAGAFRSRHLQLWQLVLSKRVEGGYESVR